MGRKVVWLLAIVTLVAGGPAVAAAQEATPTAESGIERTAIRYFLPFGPDGLNPQLAVAEEAEGFCTEGSLANIGRPDAWFCQETETNEIHDPCFENPFGPIDESATLVCVDSPFATEVIRFTTTEPLQRQKDIPTAVDASPGSPGDAVDVGPEGDLGQPPIAPVDEAADPADGAIPAEVGIDPLSLPWAVELADGERCTLLTGATAVVAGMRINYGCDGGGSIVGDLQRGPTVWTANYYDEQAVGTELVEVATVWT